MNISILINNHLLQRFPKMAALSCIGAGINMSMLALHLADNPVSSWTQSGREARIAFIASISLIGPWLGSGIGEALKCHLKNNRAQTFFYLKFSVISALALGFISKFIASRLNPEDPLVSDPLFYALQRNQVSFAIGCIALNTAIYLINNLRRAPGDLTSFLHRNYRLLKPTLPLIALSVFICGLLQVGYHTYGESVVCANPDFAGAFAK